jgi:dephospho-CoA kinase
VEAIKLVEGGLAELCDEVWLITCSAESQLARILARATARTADSPAGRAADLADVRARIAAQAQLIERLSPFATRILDTSGTPEETRVVVASAFADALAGAAV